MSGMNAQGNEQKSATKKALFIGVLVKRLSIMNDTKFSAALNGKNLYAEWIRKNLADEALAQKIDPIKDRQQLIGLLKEKISELTQLKSHELAQHVDTQASTPTLAPTDAPAPTEATPTPVPESAPTPQSAPPPESESVPTPQSTPVPESVPQSEQQPVPQSASQSETQPRPAPAQTTEQSAQPSSQDVSAPQPTVPVTESQPPSHPALDPKKAVTFLRVLSRRVGTMDDAKYAAAIKEKNPFADFVSKTIGDVAFAEKIQAVSDREKFLNLIDRHIEELKQGTQQPTSETAEQKSEPAHTAPVPEQDPAPVPKQTPILVAPESTPATPPPAPIVGSQVAAAKIDPKKVITFLRVLSRRIGAMDDAKFAASLHGENPYAAFIEKSTGHVGIADEMRKISDRQALLDFIDKHMEAGPESISEMTSAPSSPSSVSTSQSSSPSTPAPAAPSAVPMQESAPQVAVQQEQKSGPVQMSTDMSSTPTTTLQPQPVRMPVQYETPVEEYDSGINLKTMSVREILEKIGLVDFDSPYIAVEEEIIEKVEKRERLMTGVPGFDGMIGEGIPLGSTILLQGGPGSGKTTFAIQMLGAAASQGEKCLFISFEESPENLIEHMESYGLEARKYVENGNLLIMQQDPFKISRMVEALLAHARGELLIDIEQVLDILPEGFKPDRVVFDSLSAVSAAFSESSSAYRVYVTKLIEILEKTGATSFLINEIEGVERMGHGQIEEFLADGVIIFYNLQKRNVKQNALEILKMRAVNHEKKIVPFEFASGKGLVVYPLEKIFM